MSQSKFVSLPVLKLNRSRILLSLIIALHLLAFASVSYSIYFHLSVNIILGLLIGFSFYYYIQYYKNLTTLKTIQCRHDGMWVLGYESKPLLVSIEPEYMITEWLIVLRFKIGQTKRKSIPIFVDMLSLESFKQLRVVLPYILKAKNEDVIIQ